MAALKKKLAEQFTAAPLWAKAAIVLGGFWAVKKIAGAFSNDGGGASTLRDLPKATITTNDAAIIAAEQQAAMEYGFWGATDEDALINMLKPLNGNDLRLVFNAFGKKAYLFSTEAPSWMGTDINLFGWYKEELSEYWLKKMREIWRKSQLPITF